MLAYSLLVSSLVAAALAAPGQVAKRELHTVKVGADGKLTFSPPAVYAKVGDEVEFVFQAKNHSVVQSSFAQPCGPLSGGFNSKFQFVAPGTAAESLPTVKYTVTDDTKPIWFYCSQANHTPNSHCHAGMVFAINCPNEGENSLANFIKKATTDSFAVDPLPPNSDPSGTDFITPLAPEPTYAGITIPPAVAPVTKTDVITLGTSTWTTVYASYEGSPNPTPAAVDGKEIKIIVGANNELTFTPSFVQAQPRDRLVFEFQSKNHTVTQSSFAAPCSPFVSATGARGVDSGFQPVSGSPFPTFTVRVNDTTPLWFYCGQTGHCGKGMVLAVNSDEKGARSSSAFQQLAKQINGTTNNNGGGGYGGGNGAAARSTSALALAGALAAAIAFAL